MYLDIYIDLKYLEHRWDAYFLAGSRLNLAGSTSVSLNMTASVCTIRVLSLCRNIELVLDSEHLYNIHNTITLWTNKSSL